MKKRHFLWFIFLLISIPTVAQNACPADVIRAFARAGSACTDLERNQVCLGNGDVAGIFDATHQASFALVGERADTGLMQQLLLNSEDDYAVASMQLQMSLINTQPGRNVSLLAFGDVILTNQVPVRPTIMVESTGLLTIRSLPDREADIIEQYPLRTSVSAIGRFSEGDWLQVEVPNTSETGWVALDILATSDNINHLNIVDLETPLLRPFQVMTVATGHDDAPCDGAAESGILIQSPNVVDSVEMTINGVDLLLSGTVFVQAAADTDLRIHQLEGFSLVRFGIQLEWLVAGAEIAMSLDETLSATGMMSDAIPFDDAMIMGLPVNNLNYRIQLPDSVTQADIDALILDLTSEPLQISNTSIMSAERCIHTADSNMTLYAGPGTFHEVIRVISAGTQLYPVLRLSNSDGVIWWQLSNSHWMLASEANTSGTCSEIPITQVVDAPDYNTLVLETCDTTNGPVRANQWVTIEFTAGSWETLGQALEASRIDPGRITTNQDWLYVSAAHPVEVSEDRFYRTFSASWYAEVGTYRIVGNRLSYSVICDITVPVG